MVIPRIPRERGMGLLFEVMGGLGGYLIILQSRGFLVMLIERGRLMQGNKIVLVDLDGIYRVLSS
jgi:hypothetical protein